MSADLFNSGQHDVNARKAGRKIGIAFIGDKNGRAGIGNQEIGAGNADLGIGEIAAQDCARLAHHIGRHVERPRGLERIVLARETSPRPGALRDETPGR